MGRKIWTVNAHFYYFDFTEIQGTFLAKYKKGEGYAHTSPSQTTFLSFHMFSKKDKLTILICERLSNHRVAAPSAGRALRHQSSPAGRAEQPHSCSILPKIIRKFLHFLQQSPPHPAAVRDPQIITTTTK